ncbi:ABC transporter substrate-binding protein [Chromobacterium sp. IIBBL 290-4]|uniref:substrate-binding periplasmic protein n=1 Tax=Chromobacterium sp. IIBBL 290-4 TaxID=2953890 RepID=UPI0020B70590|nr:hypothetical protein [Chromobacterium sp. IIBBL 290-4]UTH72823.1 hypothetical protein NKT35_14895 [Chromobacterium sp. IIBBL 290-4]
MNKWLPLAALLGGLAAGSAQAESLRILLIQLPGVMEGVMEGEGQDFHGGGVDLLRELSRRADIPFSFEVYPQARSMLLVQQTPDTCIPLSRFLGPRLQLKWSAPVLPIQLVLFSRGDDTLLVPDLEHARKLRIGAMRGSAVAARLHELGLALEESSDYQTGLRKLQLGRLDLWGMVDIGVSTLSTRVGIPHPRAALVVDKSDIALACNPQVSDRAMSKLDHAIESMRQDGSMGRFDMK